MVGLLLVLYVLVAVPYHYAWRVDVSPTWGLVDAIDQVMEKAVLPFVRD